jgi:DNA replication and repair protein RecF
LVSHIEVHQFRNISFSKIDTGQVNLFYGENGSGKTSILEAIYYLALGRSFRSRHLERVVQKEARFFSLFAKVADIPIGLKRSLSGDFQIRVNGRDVYSTAELATYLPAQLLNHESFDLLTAGSKERRYFVDWGTFHVERDGFFIAWKNLLRVVKQRNSALKTKNPKQIKVWDNELISLSMLVNKMREGYLVEWEAVLRELISKSELKDEILLKFQQGWSQECSLEQAIDQSLEKDIAFGYTQYGAHRADVKITIDGKPAHDVLSRGQQKLFICLMKIAQAKLLKDKKNKSCVFLLDDLASELDEKRRQFVCDLLIDSGLQLFVTGIERQAMESLFRKKENNLFHVEQGEISRVNS